TSTRLCPPTPGARRSTARISGSGRRAMAYPSGLGWPAHRRSFMRLGCLGGLAFLLGSGCGGDPPVGRVTGKVTYAGKVVTQGKMVFYPEAGRAAIGEIATDGTYTLTTFRPDDGALVGKHRVSIQATRVGPGTYVTPKSIEEEMELANKGAGSKYLVAGKVE